MQKMTKRAMLIFLCLTLFLTLLPSTVLAENGENIASEEFAVLPADEAKKDERFTAYLTKLFYGGFEKNSIPGLEARLGPVNFAIEQRLKKCIEAVARGEQANTVFDVYVGDLDMDGFDSGDYCDIWNAITIDCAASLYWLDWGPMYDYNPTKDYVRFSCEVRKEYRGNSKFEVSPKKIKPALAALKNANAIIKKYAKKSDVDKLKGYMKEICRLTDYNYDALRDPKIGRDPWDLIYVFDGNPKTKVVCEGYSEAFQYLCDNTAFKSKKIVCYCVSGEVSPSGGHMWNVVRMDDGRNYVVDVTWSDDEGSSGYTNYAMFLSYAVSGSVKKNYKLTFGKRTTKRSYDEYLFDTFTVKDLTISTKPYRQTDSGKPKITAQPKSATVKAGTKVTFKVKASGKSLKYQWYYKKPNTDKWVKIEKATKASYSFVAKKSKNGYKYRCTVKNTAGKVNSKSVTLTVK